MAEEQDAGERSEEATPERREEFRERGQLVVSREVTSVIVLVACVGFLSYYVSNMIQDLERMMTTHFQQAATFRVSQRNVVSYLGRTWWQVLVLIIPIFLVDMVSSSAATFLQTRLNWSWEKLAPDFSRMNPMQGLLRMINIQAGVELLKGTAKMFAIGAVAYLVLHGEYVGIPRLMNMPVTQAWNYFGGVIKQLFWGVSGLLVFIGGADYLYNFITMERKLKMTKQEIKEEYRKRELDPHVKGRMRRMQRDVATRKMLEGTKEATVILTNPEHYAVAIKYEVGMAAPIVVAKGVDFLALRIREVAKEREIPIVENKPLARTLFKLVEVGQEIPESLYKAVSEVIRYVFKLKGIRVNKEKKTAGVS